MKKQRPKTMCGLGLGLDLNKNPEKTLLKSLEKLGFKQSLDYIQGNNWIMLLV